LSLWTLTEPWSTSSSSCCLTASALRMWVRCGVFRRGYVNDRGLSIAIALAVCGWVIVAHLDRLRSINSSGGGISGNDKTSVEPGKGNYYRICSSDDPTSDGYTFRWSSIYQRSLMKLVVSFVEHCPLFTLACHELAVGVGYVLGNERGILEYGE
jgi:hypothetical protein